jgi:hypothetical protein
MEKLLITDVIDTIVCYFCYDKNKPHPDCPWFYQGGLCNPDSTYKEDKLEYKHIKRRK